MDGFLHRGVTKQMCPYTLMDTRAIRVALLEEAPSVRSENILPHLADRFAITYVTAASEIPEAKYARVVRVPHSKFVLHRAWEISAVADSLYKQGAIDFAVSWARIGLFARRAPVLLSIGGSYAHEIGVILKNYPLSKRWRVLTGLLHYAVPEIVSARRARMITVPSEAMKQRISQTCGVPIEKIRVVPEGVGDIFFDTYEEQKFSATAKIAFVGRSHPGKGILAFARQFSKSRIEATLLIGGDGPDFPALSRIADMDRRVQLKGHVTVEQVAALLKRTTVFVWPSLYEGCPIAVLEALASGHACVAYPEGSSVEVLGESAVYAEYNNPVALCAQLEVLLQDRSRIHDLARKGRQRALQFRWENCLAKTEELYVDFYRDLRRTLTGDERHLQRRVYPSLSQKT